MINSKFLTAGLTLAMLATLAPLARAQATIDLARNRIVPVTLNDNLSVRDSQRGDSFSATVDNDYDLPRGTRLNGHVLGVHRGSNRQAPYIEVGFDEMQLPDGTTRAIDAMPVALDKGTLSRDRNGRLYGSKKVVSRNNAIAGGAVAGLVVGALVKKPLEGAILGAVAGVVVGNNQSSRTNDVNLPRGTRFGAIFQSPVHLVYSGRDWQGDRYANNNGYQGGNNGNQGGYDEYGNWQANNNQGGYAGNHQGRYSDNGQGRYTGSESKYRNDRSVRISYKGKTFSFPYDSSPYWIGNTLMVPLNNTAAKLDLNVDSSRSDTMVTVSDKDSRLRLQEGSSDYRLNGRTQTMSHQMEVRNGVTYVPIGVLAQLKHDPVLVNGTRINGD